MKLQGGEEFTKAEAQLIGSLHVHAELQVQGGELRTARRLSDRGFAELRPEGIVVLSARGHEVAVAVRARLS